MTEVEYVIANFAERFASFRGKRIVLHGSRNYAEAIIDNYADSFHFIGIMSLDTLEDECFRGLKVLREEDLSGLHPDVVILTERVKYAVEAFKSIRHVCRINKIKIYNMYGLDEFLTHREAEETGQLNLEDAKELCSSYDIVSFEVMNTLLLLSSDKTNISMQKLFYDLIFYLRKQGKEIRFSLRKSISPEIQIKALNKFGLLFDEAKELIYREGEDLSFRKLKENNPGKKILYFGVGLANEFILPRCYGIDTHRFIGVQNFDCLVPHKRPVQEKTPYNPDIEQRIKDIILKKELISFDVFDTLLLRKTLYPHDIFFLTEKKALLAGYDAKNYANARIRVEEELPYCDIDQIYLWLSDHFGWDERTTYEIQTLELTAECEALIPRTEIVELFRFAQDAGKRVVLTSDMYLPEPVLRKILTVKGITGFEKLLVSCDIKKSKHEGLYGELIRLCGNPDQILHIGDNPEADGTDCKAAGIDSILIPSVLDLAKSRGWEKTIYAASNLMERCLLGSVMAAIFQNPFQTPNIMELPVSKQIRRYGISVVASLVAGHMTWLIQNLRKESFDGVLFMARDGWLSYNIYRKIQECLALPKPVYFYANRHAAFLCCADSESEIAEVYDKGRLFGLSAAEILENVFQIPREDHLPEIKNETASDYIKKHGEIIRNNAGKIKGGYVQYSAQCGIQKDCLYAVVDGFALGNTQKYLSEFLPVRMKGFYFGKYGEPLLKDNIEYYLENQKSMLLKRFIELESFLTSCEPSLKSMAEQGAPVFAEERRSLQELQEVKTVLDAAEAFAIDFLTLFYQEGEFVSPQLIEDIYDAESFYEAQYTLYDDWLGIPIKKRDDVEIKNE